MSSVIKNVGMLMWVVMLIKESVSVVVDSVAITPWCGRVEGQVR